MRNSKQHQEDHSEKTTPGLIIGFTGTRDGMTQSQVASTRDLVKQLDPDAGRHGDCVGADADFDELLRVLGVWRVIHPPKNDQHRAFCDGDVILPPKSYLARDRDIVDRSELMIATPKEFTSKAGSGTWYTFGYAMKMKRPTYLILPDGMVKTYFISEKEAVRA